FAGALAFYIIKENPFNIQACLISNLLNPSEQVSQEGAAVGSGAEAYDHPLLSVEQEKLLESYNVDIKSLPTTIPPSIEACFVESLGAKKVEEIKSGAVPGALDILRARSCVK
ncbi:hypothetical protein KAU19_05590, partial [Candidatus Parcubacteria bacterium]|nr:hypothetical protein [Candidatus Parcubacteria bacterium]